MRLLLIDSRVRNYEAFVNACIPNEVEAIIFDFYSDNYESILSKKTRESYESIALISHNYRRPLFQLTIRESPCPLNDKSFNSWNGFYDFLIKFNTPIVDLMACSLFSENRQGSLWKNVFINLESRGAINFRASADDTGNLSAGGNWVMESDNVNVKDLYFTELISEYKNLLSGQYNDLLAWQKSNQLNTNFTPGDVYVWGDSFAGGSPEYSVDGTNAQKITTIANVVRIYSTDQAFAALTQEGDVWVWGNPSSGGSPDGPTGTGNPKKIITTDGFGGITAIYSTLTAFAALNTTGDVWIWGNPNAGGSPNRSGGSVTKITTSGFGNITAIYSTYAAFAAANADGDVWIWGNPNAGGSPNGSGGSVTKISNSYDGFGGVTAIYSTASAFAALNATGDVWVWGNPVEGGSPDGPSGDGNVAKITTSGFGDITAIYSTFEAFAALNTTGDVWVWGDPNYGGSPNGIGGGVTKISNLYDDFEGITAIYSSVSAFAAINVSGEVWVWGSPSYGGSPDGPSGAGNVAKISNSYDGFGGITAIYSSVSAFAAINVSGEVWVWGDPSYGGSPDGPSGAGNVAKISNSYDGFGGITAIYSTASAFAAANATGNVWIWGDPSYGGSPDGPTGTGNVAKISNSYDEFGGITAIYSTASAFAAANATGNVWIWGSPAEGGSSNPSEGTGNVKKIVADGFTNITAIYATYVAFAAIAIGISPVPPVPIYDIVKPIKNDAFSNLLNYLLYFPDF